MEREFSNISGIELAPGQLDEYGTVTFTESGRVYEASATDIVRPKLGGNFEPWLDFAGARGTLVLADGSGPAFLMLADSTKVASTPSLTTTEAWSHVAVSPTGRTFAIATERRVLVQADEKRIELETMKGAYYRELYVSDHFVVASGDANIDTWSVGGETFPRTEVQISGGDIAGASPSWGSEPYIAIPREDDPSDAIELRDLRTGEVVDRVELGFRASEYADFFRDCQVTAVDQRGDLIVAGSTAGELALWDRNSGIVQRRLVAGRNERFLSVAINREAGMVYAETMFEPPRSHGISGHRYLVPLEDGNDER